MEMVSFLAKLFFVRKCPFVTTKLLKPKLSMGRFLSSRMEFLEVSMRERMNYPRRCNSLVVWSSRYAHAVSGAGDGRGGNPVAMSLTPGLQTQACRVHAKGLKVAI